MSTFDQERGAMSDVFVPQPPTLADVWLSRSGLHNCKLHIVLNRVQTNLFPRFSISYINHPPHIQYSQPSPLQYNQLAQLEYKQPAQLTQLLTHQSRSPRNV